MKLSFIKFVSILSLSLVSLNCFSFDQDKNYTFSHLCSFVNASKESDDLFNISCKIDTVNLLDGENNYGIPYFFNSSEEQDTYKPYLLDTDGYVKLWDKDDKDSFFYQDTKAYVTIRNRRLFKKDEALNFVFNVIDVNYNKQYEMINYKAKLLSSDSDKSYKLIQSNSIKNYDLSHISIQKVCLSCWFP